jgi:predicted DNA-binding protein (MmcQ/YjbR family)
MDLESLREYCISKKGVIEDFPFDEETLVFKIGSKMFALTNINKKPFYVNLKCDPIMADALRRDFNAIRPGYHMNKVHWNTIDIDGTIDDNMIYWMIDNSFELVFNSLKKSEKEKILMVKE